MKKLLVLLAALLLVAGVAFAQEEELVAERFNEFFAIELGMGFPFHWTNDWHTEWWYGVENSIGPQKGEIKVLTSNVAFDIGMVFNFSRFFGLAINFDVFYGGKNQNFIGDTAGYEYWRHIAYNSSFGLNAFIGPRIYLYNDRVLRIPFGFGAHLYYFVEDLSIINGVSVSDSEPIEGFLNITDVQLGPALTLSIQFHFNQSIYIFSGFTFSVDMFRWHHEVGTGFDGATTADYFDPRRFHWGLKPQIGVGLKF